MKTKAPYGPPAPQGTTRQNLTALADEQDRLTADLTGAVKNLNHLTKLRPAHARIVMRADRHGKKRLMYLYHYKNSPTEPGTKRREEYVGSAPEKQEAAERRIVVWNQMEKLKRQSAAIRERIRQIEGVA